VLSAYEFLVTWGLLLSMDGENHCLMNVMFVVVCDAQAWLTFLMLVSRLLLRRGVDAGCECSFLVRFGRVPLVRIVGCWIAVGHSDVLQFDGVLFLVCCWYCLASKCPRCHGFGDG